MFVVNVNPPILELELYKFVLGALHRRDLVRSSCLWRKYRVSLDAFRGWRKTQSSPFCCPLVVIMPANNEAWDKPLTTPLGEICRVVY